MDDPIHVITVPNDETVMQQKPPDYDSVAGAPPTYDDAIKLNPNHLLPSVHLPSHSSNRTPSRNAARCSREESTINAFLSSSNNTMREHIPGQLEGVMTETPRSTAQIPQTPPPPYRASRAIR